jgi:ribosome-binding protein aMBF1 (putative translation factor)
MKEEKGKPARTHKSDVLNKFFSVADKNEDIKTEKHMLLAVRIDNAIKRMGYNKGQFASIMKVQPSVITKWISGTHNFTIDTLFDVESALDITLIETEEKSSLQTITTLYTVQIVYVDAQRYGCFWPNANNLLKVNNLERISAKVTIPQLHSLQD